MNVVRWSGVSASALAGVLMAGCGGGTSIAPDVGTVRQPVNDGVARSAVSGPRIAIAGQGKRLVRETFSDIATTPDAWVWSGTACLTAGTRSTPATSIPACGANAKQDRPGHGVLQLTTPNPYQVSLVGYTQQVSTAHGLRIKWNLYSFDGDGSDGTLLWMTYGDKTEPLRPAGTGGHLGYTDGTVDATQPAKSRGMANAYVGIGFDEAGNFSAFLPGGPGPVPDTVAIGGAARIGYHYLTGVENASGQPVSLPFSIEQPTSQTRPKVPVSVEVTLGRDGLLNVSFDIHDGSGYVTYLSKNIVGIAHQPRVPHKVWIGFNGSNGANYERHQIDDVRISTLRGH